MEYFEGLYGMFRTKNRVLNKNNRIAIQIRGYNEKFGSRLITRGIIKKLGSRLIIAIRIRGINENTGVFL
jgi:hypothetical protein